MTRQDRWQLMALALELRLAAREQTTCVFPIIPTARMVELAEHMEALSQRVVIVDTTAERPHGFCAWD
ncbi:hypothetical protein [Aureimonas sp. AU4]|uniref:hypothetical protein n=1 Tax=Aureimonas sp. AU4 TaxID=1638163 RepID=UPI000A509FF4|nr:hypothetical protein [Aureimonas sp. AU4]